MKELKIEYSEKFKTDCFNTLRFFMDIRLLMSAIENNRDTIVRYYLEESIDDSELYVKDTIEDDGSRKIANAKIEAHKNRQALYNQYMDLLLTTTDKSNARRNTRIF